MNIGLTEPPVRLEPVRSPVIAYTNLSATKPIGISASDGPLTSMSYQCGV